MKKITNMILHYIVRYKSILIAMVVMFILSLTITGCQKELSNEHGVTNQDQAVTAVNDTIYFLSSFLGDISIFDDPTAWANNYGGIFHCPSGCSLAYIRFRVTYQKGVSLDSFRVYTGDDYDADADPRVTRSRIKYMGGRGDSSTMRGVHFAYRGGKLLGRETSFDGGLDSTRHTILTSIKFHNIDLQDCWTRTVPDSISILSPEGKPLPVKGFLHRDWPGTVLNQVLLQR